MTITLRKNTNATQIIFLVTIKNISNLSDVVLEEFFRFIGLQAARYHRGVSQINECYFFLPAKVNKIQDVKGPGTSFPFCRIKIKKYNVEPGGAQVNNGYTNQPGPDSIADFNCVGHVVQKEAVIIIKGRIVTTRVSGSQEFFQKVKIFLAAGKWCYLNSNILVFIPGSFLISVGFKLFWVNTNW